MTIDGRSSLGLELEVDQPVECDLRQLDDAAGRLIVDRMERKGLSREEAMTDLLNFAGSVLKESVVHIDTGPVYAGYPEVRQAVADTQRNAAARGKKMGVGRALTVLIVAGAEKKTDRAAGPGAQPSAPTRTRAEEIAEGIDDIIAGGVDLMRGMFGKDRRDKSV
ncbi:MAG TPA: hypothetical protein VK694_00145 [Verrucomicrobiae bacterium]|nr:hypothetical protein [Verrucomicrobiae bacterium]